MFYSFSIKQIENDSMKILFWYETDVFENAKKKNIYIGVIRQKV